MIAKRKNQTSKTKTNDAYNTNEILNKIFYIKGIHRYSKLRYEIGSFYNINPKTIEYFEKNTLIVWGDLLKFEKREIIYKLIESIPEENGKTFKEKAEWFETLLDDIINKSSNARDGDTQETESFLFAKLRNLKIHISKNNNSYDLNAFLKEHPNFSSYIEGKGIKNLNDLLKYETRNKLIDFIKSIPEFNGKTIKDSFAWFESIIDDISKKFDPRKNKDDEEKNDENNEDDDLKKEK